MRLPVALAIQNDPIEPPGRLTEWLPEAGVLVEVKTPYDGAPLPSTLAGYSALIVMGGTMGAHDDDKAEWLAPTKNLLREAISSGLPALGICLGSQLLAVAAGGRVDKSDTDPELGPSLVAKRDAAASDPLFGSVPFTPDVVQWHYDQISELPPGALLLASSPRYENQAFRIGDRAYGLLFHIETTPELVRSWVSREATTIAELNVDPDRLVARLDEAHADMEDVWQPFARRFAELARQAEFASRTS